MAAIGEQSLQWFSAERVEAVPDLTSLVRDHSGLLYRVAFSVLRNPAEAEDVVQEVFLRVLQRQHELSGIIEVRPWLIRIALNMALDRRRRIRPGQMDESFAASLVAADLPADQRLADASRVRCVLDALERLPAKEREALLLSAMDDLSTAEIAAALSKSESSVRSLLFRARTRLRDRLGD
jgi:RNA polymerase sigma-70 factor (ECF subfamily)